MELLLRLSAQIISFIPGLPSNDMDQFTAATTAPAAAAPSPVDVPVLLPPLLLQLPQLQQHAAAAAAPATAAQPSLLVMKSLDLMRWLAFGDVCPLKLVDDFTAA